MLELRAESAVSKRRFDENAVLRQRLAKAGEHTFEFIAKCEPEGSARVATEMRRNGG